MRGCSTIFRIFHFSVVFFLIVATLTAQTYSKQELEQKSGVQWRPLLTQSLFFLGMEHGFRLATEPGTRAGMRGPFFNGYREAVSNLHGWADGDPFLVNYVGHPMQGAVTGYLFVQNDPLYRTAEFGRNARYWRSRLRATGYSWAYSAQFEIGLLSEASLGKVQRDHPQQGFVDQVITPVVGLGWMITEDAVDKYIIKRIEARTTNNWVRLLVRGGLNPSRSMSNALRGKPPWHRDSRPGVLQYDPPWERSVAQLSRPKVEPPRPQWLPAPFEYTTHFQTAFLGGNAQEQPCVGGGGQAAFRLSPSWQMVGDVSGCQRHGIGTDVSGDSLTFLAGPRWTPQSSRRISPYVQLLVGGTKLTQERLYPELREAVRRSGRVEQYPGEFHREYTDSAETHGFTVALGGGVDVGLTRALAWRVANIEYTRQWMRPVEGLDYNRQTRVTMGLVLRMGTW